MLGRNIDGSTDKQINHKQIFFLNESVKYQEFNNIMKVASAIALSNIF